jgi:hypothetical protein
VALVSGVCRKASAPMLSHGGSRLNASKPEANPKTRCPMKFIELTTLCRLVPRGSPCFGSASQTRATHRPRFQKVHLSNRHSKQRSLCGPRRRKVHHIITRETFENRDLSGLARGAFGPNRRHLTNKPHHYVPLQTREHAWAGIDGMPRSCTVGSRGILRPETLNLEACRQ